MSECTKERRNEETSPIVPIPIVYLLLGHLFIKPLKLCSSDSTNGKTTVRDFIGNIELSSETF